jgi:hypothetical protein
VESYSGVGKKFKTGKLWGWKFNIGRLMAVQSVPEYKIPKTKPVTDNTA